MAYAYENGTPCRTFCRLLPFCIRKGRNKRLRLISAIGLQAPSTTHSSGDASSPPSYQQSTAHSGCPLYSNMCAQNPIPNPYRADGSLVRWGNTTVMHNMGCYQDIPATGANTAGQNAHAMGFIPPFVNLGGASAPAEEKPRCESCGGANELKPIVEAAVIHKLCKECVAKQYATKFVDHVWNRGTVCR